MSGYKKQKGSLGKVREHTIVASKALGRPLKYPECIHHVDGNGWNNKNENLVICPNQAYHFLLHIRETALLACGNANYRKCMLCGRYDDPGIMAVHTYAGNCTYVHMVCRRERRRLRG